MASDFRIIFSGWLLMALIPWVSGWLKDKVDQDYSIFSHSFWHAWQQMSLYTLYPEDGNLFLYGPLFAVLVAPLAVLPFSRHRLKLTIELYTQDYEDRNTTHTLL